MKVQSVPQASLTLKSKNRLENIFQSPAFQALTIGVPFCVYKGIFGVLSKRMGLEQMSEFLVVFGWMVLAWATIDLMMNLARVFFQFKNQASPIEYCAIAQIGRHFNSPRLFLAVDTLISFSIICFVLWSKWITHLSWGESYLWNFATTLNLISISVVNIWLEFRRR